MKGAFKIFTTILISIVCLSCNAQNLENQNEFRKKTGRIDSLVSEIDKNPYLVEGIAEGGFVNHKGGWETYDLKDKNGTELFRIINNSTYDGYDSNKFYYWNNKLIKAIIEKQDWNSGKKKILYSAVYYFENEKLLKSENENLKYSNAKDVLKLGNSHKSAFYETK